MTPARRSQSSSGSSVRAVRSRAWNSAFRAGSGGRCGTRTSAPCCRSPGASSHPDGTTPAASSAAASVASGAATRSNASWSSGAPRVCRTCAAGRSASGAASSSGGGVATRPAFYALEPGSWRDYVTMLHLPYTLWHLAYVVIGACLAPHLPVGRTALTVLAFFLALGICAHALDELNGRPLQTRIARPILVALAAVSLAGAVAIGLAVAVVHDLWLLPFIAFGGFIVCAYNLELFGGAFHNGVWLALSWGAFPILTAYFAAADTIRVEAVLAAAFGALLIVAQRTLSTPVRDIRRRATGVTGTIERPDGTSEPITATTLTRPAEVALRFIAAAVVALAPALLALRLA